MNIEKRRIEELKPAEYNPRKNLQPGDAEYEKIKNSLLHFGYVDPIIINKDGTIIGGHQRATVMKDLGTEEAECVVLDLSKEDEKALNVALNKISGEWDMEKLGVLLEELNTVGVMELTGFDVEEYTKMFVKDEVKEDDFDLENNIPKVPFSKQGDIWKLGNHKVICGDSTIKETYIRLLENEQIDVVITDPPYNVDYSSADGKKIQNDNFKDEESFHRFLVAFYTRTFEACKSGAPIYVFHADTEAVNFRKSFMDAGFCYKQCLIWVKNSLVMGRQDYHWRHEPILYGWKPGAGHKWYGDRDKDTVIDDFVQLNPKKMSKSELVDFFQKLIDSNNENSTVIYNDKPTRSEEHPTMKPVTLVAKLMLNSSKKDDIVFDGFGGSGSTLIAAEQLERKCYLIELDEKYVDVIVKRYLQFKGSADTIRLIRDGKEYTYEEVIGGEYMPS